MTARGVCTGGSMKLSLRGLRSRVRPSISAAPSCRPARPRTLPGSTSRSRLRPCQTLPRRRRRYRRRPSERASTEWCGADPPPLAMTTSAVLSTTRASRASVCACCRRTHLTLHRVTGRRHAARAWLRKSAWERAVARQALRLRSVSSVWCHIWPMSSPAYLVSVSHWFQHHRLSPGTGVSPWRRTGCRAQRPVWLLLTHAWL